MSDKLEPVSLHNGSNAEYKAPQLTESTWLNFCSNPRLRQFVFALTAAVNLVPIGSVLGEEHSNVTNALLNTSFTNSQPLESSKESLSEITTKIERVIQEAEKATNIIRDYRVKNGIKFVKSDTTGWIGPEDSSITSIPGNYDKKEKTTNVQLAGKILSMMIALDLKENDHVTISTTGSNPPVYVYTRLALKQLGIKSTTIMSVASSQFGATHPKLPITKMEEILVQAKMFDGKSVAASLGGKDDIGADVRKPELLSQAIRDAHIPFIETFTREGQDARKTAIDERMKIYGDLSQIKIHINVGGGLIAVGDKDGFRLPFGVINPHSSEYAKINWNDYQDCVVVRMLKAGVTVVNLRHIDGNNMDMLALKSSAPAVNSVSVIK